ncbi:hypothetical protein JT358_06205 [Micrococcales bacterium 31B]|nr:hypothetical protein [Micrococcales bacterium 31B]
MTDGSAPTVALEEYAPPPARGLLRKLGFALPQRERAAYLVRLLEQPNASDAPANQHLDLPEGAAASDPATGLAPDEAVAWRTYRFTRRIFIGSAVAGLAGLLILLGLEFGGDIFGALPTWVAAIRRVLTLLTIAALIGFVVNLVLARRLRFIYYVLHCAQQLCTLRRWGGSDSGAVVDQVSRASIILFNLATMQWFSPMVPPVLQARAARYAYAVICPLYVHEFSGIYATGHAGERARRLYAFYLHDIAALVAVGRSDLVALYCSRSEGLSGTVTNANELDVSEDMMDYYVPVKGSRGITFVKEAIVPFASLMSVTIALVALILSRMGS